MHAESTHQPAHLPPGIAAALSRRFERIVVFSGAGMSAESGIPTYRSGHDALWKQFIPDEWVTLKGWQRDKEAVWGWHQWRRGFVMRAQPNPGHLAVGQLQREFGAAVITQNVDDLHERGGASHVLHLHGSLFAARCCACAEPYALDAPPPMEQQRIAPPRCPRCGGTVRPGVVWFGDKLPKDVVQEASALVRSCDLLLIVGTSGTVYPAANMVERAPARAVVIEVNPAPQDPLVRRSWTLRRSLHLQTTAAVGLPLIYECLQRGGGI